MVRSHVIRRDHLEDAELRVELREAGDAGDPAGTRFGFRPVASHRLASRPRHYGTMF